MTDKRIRTDVIIPVYKPDQRFEELLDRLLKQTYPVHRIIIMNTEERYWDHETYRDQFAAARDRNTEILVFHLAKQDFDHGGTRHLGFTKSDAEVCICMTQDAVPADKYVVEKLVEALYEEEKTAVSYGRQLPASDCGVVERRTREFNYPADSRVKSAKDLETLGIKTYFCSNVCAAYRREIYLVLGGFTTRTIFNEDMIFAAGAVKAGYKIAYAAGARVIHSHNYTAMEQLHRNFDLAVSQADHPEEFSGLSAEGEGLRLVADTAAWLLRSGRWYLLPDLVVKSGFKYAGYRLGKMYRRLPKKLILKLTMNRAYWE